MAEAIVSVAAETVLSAVVDELIGRLTVRWGLQLRSRLEVLEIKLSHMFDVLYRIDTMKGPNQPMSEWATEARDDVCSIEVLMDDLMSKRGRRIGANLLNRPALFFTDIFLEFQFRPKVNHYVLRIDDLLDRNSVPSIEVSNSMTQRSNQYSKETVVIGFEEHVNEITERLLPRNKPRCVIFIVGMEGSGKTFLAESIYDNNAAHFDIHAWVSISQERSAEDILQDIMEKVIGSDHQELKGKQSLKEELKQMLQNFLREKRYLIVLDKIPMSGFWDDLKDAFPDQSNGGRIMITTRDMDLSLYADSGIFHYKMQLLSTDESWTLFKN